MFTIELRRQILSVRGLLFALSCILPFVLLFLFVYSGYRSRQNYVFGYDFIRLSLTLCTGGLFPALMAVDYALYSSTDITSGTIFIHFLSGAERARFIRARSVCAFIKYGSVMLALFLSSFALSLFFESGFFYFLMENRWMGTAEIVFRSSLSFLVLFCGSFITVSLASLLSRELRGNISAVVFCLFGFFLLFLASDRFARVPLIGLISLNVERILTEPMDARTMVGSGLAAVGTALVTLFLLLTADWLRFRRQDIKWHVPVM